MDNNNHFKSLNSTLPEFYLEKLEERLETDPLTTGGLLEGVSKLEIDIPSDFDKYF